METWVPTEEEAAGPKDLLFTGKSRFRFSRWGMLTNKKTLWERYPNYFVRDVLGWVDDDFLSADWEPEFFASLAGASGEQL